MYTSGDLCECQVKTQSGTFKLSLDLGPEEMCSSHSQNTSLFSRLPLTFSHSVSTCLDSSVMTSLFIKASVMKRELSHSSSFPHSHLPPFFTVSSCLLQLSSYYFSIPTHSTLLLELESKSRVRTGVHSVMSEFRTPLWYRETQRTVVADRVCLKAFGN